VSDGNIYDRYARLVTRHPRKVLLVITLLVAWLGFSARHVRLDNNFAALFSTNSEAAEFRKTYRELFGADDGLLIAVLDAEQPADPRFIALVEDISRKAALWKDVRRVYSATETSVLFRDGDTTVIGPGFGSGSSFRGDHADRVRLVTHSRLGGNRLVSDDGHVFLAVAELDSSIDSYEKILEPASRYERMVKDAVEASKLPIHLHFAGIPYTRIGAIATMQGDLLFLTPLTTCALAVMLFFFFRRALAVVIPLACVLASVVATAGVIGLAGDNLNQLTVIYPVLLMVMAGATAIHFVHRYQEERAEGKSAEEAACVTAARITEASMLQTLTTVFGFGSLLTSQMKILHGFGLYLSLGVTFAFVFVVVAIPAMLVLWGDYACPKATLRRAPHTDAPQLHGRYARIVRWMVRPRVSWTVTVAMLAGFVGLCFASRGAVYDYRLSDNVFKGHPVAEGNAIIDSRMAGIVPIEVAFVGGKDAFLDPETLRRIERCGEFLEREAKVRAPISLASLVRELNRSISGNDAIPDNREAIAQLLLFADGSPDRVVEQLTTADYARTRLRATIPDRGARYVVDLEQRFRAFADPLFAGTGVTARLTGEAPVAYDGMNRLSAELVTSELWALVLVTVSIGAVFRSAKVALASFLPNALPVLMALTFYTVSGRAIDPLPGIVFCIGIGLTVDDTIHVIARYREELRAGFPRDEAMVRTMTSMSGALLSTSVALGGGFLVLCLSSFNMNRTMGWLGALMLALAWVFEVVCTPAALVLFEWRVGHGATATSPAPSSAIGAGAE
jgi:hydrophobe/amphiphile efflux-3 (HAE3) family protein